MRPLEWSTGYYGLKWVCVLVRGVTAYDKRFIRFSIHLTLCEHRLSRKLDLMEKLIHTSVRDFQSTLFIIKYFPEIRFK